MTFEDCDYYVFHTEEDYDMYDHLEYDHLTISQNALTYSDIFIVAVKGDNRELWSMVVDDSFLADFDISDKGLKQYFTQVIPRTTRDNKNLGWLPHVLRPPKSYKEYMTFVSSAMYSVCINHFNDDNDKDIISQYATTFIDILHDIPRDSKLLDTFFFHLDTHELFIRQIRSEKTCQKVVDTFASLCKGRPFDVIKYTSKRYDAPINFKRILRWRNNPEDVFTALANLRWDSGKTLPVSNLFINVLGAYLKNNTLTCDDITYDDNLAIGYKKLIIETVQKLDYREILECLDDMDSPTFSYKEFMIMVYQGIDSPSVHRHLQRTQVEVRRDKKGYSREFMKRWGLNSIDYVIELLEPIKESS